LNTSRNVKLFINMAVVFLAFVLLSGCTIIPDEGVTVNNEVQLQKEGFIMNPNKEIKVGTARCQIKKIVFDRESMTFITKGKLQLSEDVIEIGSSLDNLLGQYG